MNGELERLERVVEREMEMLHLLPREQPSGACLLRLRAAVLAESRRTRRRLMPWARSAMLGAAAAVALLVGWYGGPAGDLLEVDASLRDWGTALEDSNTRLARAVQEGWTRGSSIHDVETELDDLLRSLDESLARFQNL